MYPNTCNDINELQVDAHKYKTRSYKRDLNLPIQEPYFSNNFTIIVLQINHMFSTAISLHGAEIIVFGTME